MTNSFRRNLVIVHSPGAQSLSDWVTVAEKINVRAPDIDVRIINNGRPNTAITEWQLSRPSLVFSPCNLVNYRPAGGKVYVGRQVDKLEQMRRLWLAGIKTPRTLLLSPGLSLDPAVWGDYVVVKPSSGKTSNGRGLVVVLAESVGDRFAELTGGGQSSMIVQKLIDATDGCERLYAYRVLTIFGRALYAATLMQLEKRPSLAKICDQGSNRIAHNAVIKGLKYDLRLVKDLEVLELAAQTAEAMREFPVLGVDIIRERSTRDLYVLETNSGGNVWHLSSRNALSTQRAKMRRSKYRQFDALDIVADTLIDKTRQEASFLTPLTA